MEKKKVRNCTLCGRKLSIHNPKETCFHHNFPTNHDPKGDTLRRVCSCNGISGRKMTATIIQEQGAWQ